MFVECNLCVICEGFSRAQLREVGILANLFKIFFLPLFVTFSKSNLNQNKKQVKFHRKINKIYYGVKLSESN